MAEKEMDEKHDKTVEDEALKDGYDEIFEFLDEYYGKPTKKKKTLTVRFKVSKIPAEGHLEL